MSISFSGLASGMDTASWVEALVEAKTAALIKPLEQKYELAEGQKSALNTVRSKYSTLLSATQVFTDSKFGASKDIFSSNTVSSTDSKKVNATVTNSTSRQTLNVEVLRLATSTKVSSQSLLNANIDETTLVSSLANGSVKPGTMSFYVGDEKFQIDVKTGDSLGDLIAKIEEATQDENGESLVTAEIQDGKFMISAKDGTSVRVGTTSDSSTITQALSLVSKEDGTVQSANAISALNASKPLTSVDSGLYTIDENGQKISLVSAGTFTIGDAEITITDETTMNDLITKINSTPSTGVKAYYDSVQNKMILTASQEGAFNVNIEAGSSNITDVFGFTSNGNIVSDTQVLGQNAEVKINGSTVQAYSNTLTSEVTGVAGLTLELNGLTEENESITVEVGQDTDKIVKEVKSLLEAMNSMISISDEATASGAYFQYDSSINGYRNSVRSVASTTVNSGTYKTLSSIGITTGEIGASVDADTNKFILDEEKLKEALANDPESVKKLLIGDEDAGVNGIVTQVANIVDQTLDSDGFFSTRAETISSQMSSISEQITNKESYIASYQERWEKKFQAMEKAIADMQAQYSKMSAITG